MNEEPKQKKCVNCYTQVTKGIYCHKCDAVIFSAWALEDYQEDPVLRTEFLNQLEKDRINTTFDMERVAKDKKSLRLEKLSKKIYRLLYKFSLSEHIDIFTRAVNFAKNRNENEIAASNRLSTLNAEKKAMQAVKEAYEAIKEDTHLTQFDTTSDRNRKAYATFDPTISDPDECPF
jgi:uncharacterized protein YwqG